MTTIDIVSRKRVEMIDITHEVCQVIAATGIASGLALLQVPHTTAAVTINENADPDVTRDITMELNKIIPFEDRYQHGEGNSAAHIKSSLVGAGELLIIKDSKPVLGTWQGIYFCEFDGPRQRKMHIKVLAG